MSVSPAMPMSENKAIPRRMFITDPSQMPSDYSSTPGGTLYSTTPGGTKIVYDRSFLMNLRNSPISQTPPKCSIPSGLVRGMPHSPVGNCLPTSPTIPIATIEEAGEQFAMEI